MRNIQVKLSALKVKHTLTNTHITVGKITVPLRADTVDDTEATIRELIAKGMPVTDRVDQYIKRMDSYAAHWA